MNQERHKIVKQTAAVHRENIQKNLQHRLEVARTKGDQQLVRLLEAEASYFN